MRRTVLVGGTLVARPTAAAILAVICGVAPIVAFVLSVACIDGWRDQRDSQPRAV